MKLLYSMKLPPGQLHVTFQSFKNLYTPDLIDNCRTCISQCPGRHQEEAYNQGTNQQQNRDTAMCDSTTNGLLSPSNLPLLTLTGRIEQRQTSVHLFTFKQVSELLLMVTIAWLHYLLIFATLHSSFFSFLSRLNSFFIGFSSSLTGYRLWQLA